MPQISKVTIAVIVKNKTKVENSLVPCGHVIQSHDQHPGHMICRANQLTAGHINCQYSYIQVMHCPIS